MLGHYVKLHHNLKWGVKMQYIEFDDFSAYYKQRKLYAAALDHLSLKIEKGSFFVVAGASGSGKSTLLKCLLGLNRDIEGSLYIDGVSIDDWDAKDGNVSYVTQEIALYPHLTVYENIAFPLRLMHTPQDEVDRRVKEIAELVRVKWLLTRKPRQLSGGQQQRVAIARAMIKNPQLLLFDEPFSNVDPSLRLELRQLVKQIHHRFGATTVFVTHDLTEAFFLADQIAVLDEGNIVDFGTPEQLREVHHSSLLKAFFESEGAKCLDE